MRGGVRRGRRAAAVVGILIALAPAAGRARLQAGREANAGANDAAADGRASVEITIVGTPAHFTWVRGLVGPGALGGEAVRWTRADSFEPAEILDAGREGPAGAALLRCWIDLTDTRRARLYFAAKLAERYLIRNVELSGNFDEVDRASLAEVLEPSIAALLEDKPTGLTRTETQALLAGRAPAAPPVTSRPAAAPPIIAAAPPSPRRRSPLRLGVFYAALALSGGPRLDQGPGLWLSSPPGQAAERRGAAVWLSGQYRFATEVRDDQAGVALDTVAARAGLELRGRLLAARLGAGADFVHVSPQRGTLDPSAALAAAHWSTDLAVTGSFGAAMTVGAGTRIAVNLFADVLPTSVHYDLEIGGRASPVFSPWRVRPGLALEVTLL